MHQKTLTLKYLVWISEGIGGYEKIREYWKYWEGIEN